MKDNRLALSIEREIANSSTTGWFSEQAGRKQTVPCISFFQYMNNCLYDADYGYYRSGPVRIGKEGDFYTSSAIGHVMSEVLAGYINEYGRLMDKPLKLIEWGAGTGRLSAQIAAACRERRRDWDKQFTLIQIEDNPSHVQAGRIAHAHIAAQEAALAPIFATSEEAFQASWLKQPAIILANELLDAFPVHRVQVVNGELMELGVAGTAAQGFHYVYMPLSDQRINGWLKRDGIALQEGQQTEVASATADWLQQLGTVMMEGRLVLIDYGHEAAEYTAEHRMDGTLMCYWRHQASDQPFLRVGEQDITAHVPFTFVRHCAEESGWKVVSYTTQKQFLMDHGVVELLQNHYDADPFSETSRKNRAIRQLLISDQMSETFKVMVLDKK